MQEATTEQCALYLSAKEGLKMTFNAVVSLDLEEQERRATTANERFKLQEGQEAILVALRRPEESQFCTDLTRFHWFDGGADNSYRIPCGKLATTPQQCLVCAAHANTMKDQSFVSLAEPIRKFLKGSQGYDMQVLDLTACGQLIQNYQAARGTAAEASALVELQERIMQSPIKTWNISQTVYSDFISQLKNHKREMGGVFEDPTLPLSARPINVTKRREGSRAFATYHLSVWWRIEIPLPEALFEGEKVLSIGGLYDRQFGNSLALWPATRVLQVLEAAQLAHGLHGMNTLPTSPTRPVLASPTPQPMPVSVVSVPPMIEPSAPKAAAGTTTSAASLPCFGKQFDFKAQSCAVCATREACVSAMMGAASASAETLTKAATTALPTPGPVVSGGEATVVLPAEAPVTAEDIASKVADIVARAQGKE
jgi:hypothetical protein